MKYDEISDFEINAQVTMLRYNLQGWAYSDNMQQFYHCGACGNETHTQPVIDYCNNWSDIGPIIVENEISLIRDVSTTPAVWEAVGKAWFTHLGLESSLGLNFEVINPNPLRAAAICFLMMQESK